MAGEEVNRRIAGKRIAIIGAGPIGLEAALYARLLGHDVIVFEKGDLAANVRSWGFVQLFSPWHMDVTPLGISLLGESARWIETIGNVCPLGSEFVDRYLEPLSRIDLLQSCVRLRTTVLNIGREESGKPDEIGRPARARSPFRILVVDDRQQESVELADVVLDCSGTYGNHRWAGRGGIPAPGERALQDQIRYVIPDVLGRDREIFADKHTLMLGAGYSAATVLGYFKTLQQARPRTQLSWAIRRPGQALQAVTDDPLTSRRSLAQQSMRLSESPPEWLQFLGNCVMEKITGGPPFDVTLKFLSTDLVLHVDQVVALVGYVPDHSMTSQLQVHPYHPSGGPNLAAALLGQNSSDSLSTGAALAADTLKNPESNFFILGAKSYGTHSSFLLQVGHKQIRDAFKLIENDDQLDLYRRELNAESSV